MSQSASSGIAPDLFLADVDSPEAAPASGFPIAAIGASAGGLTALSKLLESVPADSGIGFVVITHLDPTRESLMPGLLARHTPMRVSHAEENQAVRPNEIYVIPPGNTMTIERGVLHLQPQRGRHHSKPIDLFMTHLARDQKSGGIAIVLTGIDSDGTIGVKQIKAEGGMVMVQDPYSAEYADMPRNAAATGLSDFVLPVEEMGESLLSYIRTAGLHEEAGPEIAPSDNEQISAILLALHQGGEPDFREYKPGMIMRRIKRRMGITGIKALADFRKYIEQSADGRRMLATDFLVGVTEFFREPRGWVVLAESILPQLFQHHDGDKPLRVWIPACASGQEAYSMAMLLSEHAELSNKRARIEIFATDIDRHALDRGRAGIYPASVAHTLSPERLQRFFVQIDGAYQVRKELRSLILFSSHNLLRDPPFSRMDIISCRNLLIYLQPAMQRHVTSLFSFSLNEGGYLLLGRSEGIADPQGGAFEELFAEARIYRRKPGMRPRTLKFQVTDFAGDLIGAGDGITGRAESTAQLVHKTLLARCTPAAALVDRSFQVLYFHGDVDPFLRRATGAPTHNILDMARDGLGIKIRTLIQQATEESRMTSALAQIMQGNLRMRVGISVLAISESPRAGPLYLVTFSQLPGAISGNEGTATELAVAGGEQLSEARQEVQEMIQDLRETNEELMSANEELQSANEELASSKEEMQSLNEEMNAVNAQLEMKVGELEATTDDLNNFLRNARIACLFLDRDMNIKRFTAPMTQLFKLIPSDVGRPIADFSSAFLDQRLIADAQQSLASLGSNETQLRTHDGKWYWRYIQPYETVDNHVEGVVVTYLDISSLKRAEEGMRRLATILQDSNDAVIVHDFNGHVQVWNHAAERMYGYSAAEMQSINVSTLVPPMQKEQFATMLARARQGEAMPSLETQRVARDGRILDVGITVSVVRDEQGNASGISTTERDISERLRAQEQLQYRALRLQEADRRRTEFLAMLGHELRNPLAPVRNVLHLMREGNMSAEQLSWATALMERQTAHLSRLIDDLLDVSRITSGKVHLQRGRVEIRSVIDNAIEAANPLLQERNHRLTVNVPAEPMSVFGDAARLQQVVGNLLTNAFKYTRRGGDIRIEAAQDDGEITIRVTDNGMGIKPDLLPHIFDLFVQGDQTIDRSQGGLGIGLTLVRQLVEMHGGSVDVRSEGVDKGAEFVMHLPGMPEQRSSDRQALTQDQFGTDATHRKILIVDDNEDFASSLQLLLQSEHHEVQIAHDGMGGIEIARAFKPDVILLDLGLPGFNGYETAQRLRAIAELHDVMLIAVSGYAQEEDRQRSKKAGFNSHLKKPVDIRQVLEAIR